jgi:NADPH-dependent 2,4-dienoyl-CoA reductase/sulfur reductase-like enzyme
MAGILRHGARHWRLNRTTGLIAERDGDTCPKAVTLSRHLLVKVVSSGCCDVAVIGGSAAGGATALQLGRQRGSVIVVDAGEQRNAPGSHAWLPRS